ncbi:MULTISPECIES: hypothetical protein [Nostocales]|uniref:PEP-CTERM protein-sorting domain-containing protein n=1 Tax=Tolypothrix bouteillei VB521301 TaxID=1479485 RepID=A0A0C1RA55_9CYAN
MVRFNIAWLTPVAITLLSFGLYAKRAMAVIGNPFEAKYNTEYTFVPITDNISRVAIIAESEDAPYGLTYFLNATYSLNDPTAESITFNSNPTELGFNDLPPAGDIIFYGEGRRDNLFGTLTSKSLLDFQNLIGTTTGTVSITDGSGKFKGATGIFSFIESNTLDPNTKAPLKSQIFLKGSFQTVQSVPEPTSITTLVIIGMIGAAFQLRQHRD